MRNGCCSAGTSTTSAPRGFFGNPPTRKSSPDAYREYLRAAKRAGDYFPLFRRHCAKLGLPAAALVLHLLNVGQQHCDPRGFFMATTRFVADGIGLDREGQAAAFAELCESGICEVEIREGKRWVRVDLDALRRAVDS